LIRGCKNGATTEERLKHRERRGRKEETRSSFKGIFLFFSVSSVVQM
jgi:hypothetical protein